MNSRLGLIALFTLLTSLTLTIPSPLLLGKKFERGNRVFAQTVTERKAEADRLLEQGIQQNTTSQYQAAIQSLETALNIFREIGDRNGEGFALGNLGIAYNRLGQYQKAIEFYQQSLTIFREIGDRNGEGSALNNLGIAYRSLGQYQKAIEFYQQSLTIAREIGDRNGEGGALNNLGIAYRSLGQYQKAIEFYQQSLTIAREIGNRNGEGFALGNLGIAYNSLGQYQKAIEFYQQSLTIFREIGDRNGEGSALGNLGNAYDSLGQYQKAIEFFQQSLTIFREIGNRNGEGFALGNLGIAYNSLGQYQKAIEFYQQSLTIFREIGNRNGEGFALNNLGIAYRSLGQYQKAIEFYQQSLTIAREIGDRNGEGGALNNLGIAYRSLGQYQKAIEFFQQSLTIFREIGDRNGEGLALNNLGLALFKLKNFPEAEKYLFFSLEVRESLRQGIQDDLDKVSLSDTQRSSYNLLQQVLIAQNKTEPALEVSERGRGRALVELLSQRFNPNSEPFSPVVSLAQLQAIARQQNATIVQYSWIFDDFSQDGKQQYRESELYIWVIKPTGEVEFRQADLKLLWQEQNTSLSDIIFAARCFGNDACRSDFITASASSNVVTRSNLTSTPPQYRELKELHQLLIKPIEDLLPTNPDERVIFVPTDALFYLPFAALVDEEGKFLIEKHTIVMSPAITVLETTHKQRQNLSSSAQDIVIVGNPQMPKLATSPGEEPQPLASLRYAEKEAIEIAKMFNTSALIGANATESTVVERLKTARIIHFATHGIVDNIQPLNSSVALTPGGSEDGLLTADEIFDLKLNAELVVLSACDTGLGQLTGDGMIGLSRSFLNAGVPSLVMSLWAVDDRKTSQLMIQFYQNLQTTPNKAQALRQAMLTMKNQYPDPYYWAAFTLIGEAE
ncbi:Tetratricopeptide repeat protein 28 [Planktothrix agardhii]|uniref:CHAT domain-containing protein n=1 Tax=Planktothrix agardhii TaxID=1160 RepID=UPI0020A702EC|nr:tetratricopeptide repeat protein [Planktothrix agardhii]CAD5929561.1 Tetratricopeptide repeat protein 28 [Planktothrix agardhii]CAD5946173.1 Tetratricopeptide repeat protein 28 [Planktothrix agardhii]